MVEGSSADSRAIARGTRSQAELRTWKRVCCEVQVSEASQAVSVLMVPGW